MNIDLFLTPQNEGGLVCDGTFPVQIVGIIFDAKSRELTLEFVDHSTFHLSIPMEEEHIEKILMAQRMHVGFMEDRLLMDAFEVPLYYLNDPYGGDFGRNASLAGPLRAVLAFEQFIKRCSFAQALHRDDLGDENEARSVLKGADPQALQLSPALQRQMQMGAAPKTGVAPVTPSSPGIGSGGTAQPQRALKQARKDDTDKGDA